MSPLIKQFCIDILPYCLTHGTKIINMKATAFTKSLLSKTACLKAVCRELFMNESLSMNFEESTNAFVSNRK